MKFLKRKNNNGEEDNLDRQFIYGLVLAEVNRETPDQRARESEQTNIHSFLDYTTTQYLESAALIGYDKNGKPVFDPSWLALLISLTRMSALSYVDRQAALIQKLKAERMVGEMRRKMDYRTMQRGGAQILEAALGIIRRNWDCAVDGRLLKWVKTNPRPVEINIPQMNQGKK
jgi:hypothetical protein